MQLTIAGATLTIEDHRIDSDISTALEQYMSGERVVFNQEIDISDLTGFQQHVLNEIRQVPYGETVTYAELAESIEKPRAYRAVANACGVNPVPIVIPCHRVVATNTLGGYSSGVEIKKELLMLEGMTILSE